MAVARISQLPIHIAEDSADQSARISSVPIHVAWKSTDQSARLSQVPIHLAYALTTPENPCAARAVVTLPERTHADGPDVLPYLYIPQGQGQSVDELGGESSISEMEAHCIDPRGELKRLLADPELLGTEAEFRLGFPGMNLADFVILSKHQIIKAGWTNEGRVILNLQDLQRYTKDYIWYNGGPSAWSPGMVTPDPPVGPSYAANDQPVFDSNPRYIQGNPIDMLLVAVQNELGIGQTDPTDPSSWQLYIPGDDSTLINPNIYFDIDMAVGLRDGQFSGDWMEFVIKAQEEGKSWIEDQILKPLGLYFVVLSTGVLTIKSMKSPVSTNPETWTNHSIMGIPELDRWDIINVLQARFNVDDSGTSTASRKYNADIAYEDLTSINQFRQQLIQQAEFTGMRTRRGAMGRAFILADRVFRRHGYGTPVYTCTVQLRNLRQELAEYVLLTHPLVLDLYPLSTNAGKMGLTDVECEIIDRQPNYSEGTFEFKLIDTRFVQQTVAYKIALNSTPVWTSATTQEKETYLFISNDSGKMSDDSDANTLF